MVDHGTYANHEKELLTTKNVVDDPRYTKGTIMDFVTLLRRDHEKLSSIFDQIQGGFDQPDTPERHQLFRQLKRELELHAAVEDLQVYRIFQQAESTHDDAHDALEAH